MEFDFTKVVMPWRVEICRSPVNVFCEIKYKAGRLSITGVEGPRAGGSCVGACGQIAMDTTPDSVTPGPGWNTEMVRKFLEIWDEWHLNDMISGSPAQERYLKSIRDEFPGYPKHHYDWACEELEKAGLNPDPGLVFDGVPYKYGTMWLRKDVPVPVLYWLKGLPDSPVKPDWV